MEWAQALAIVGSLGTLLIWTTNKLDSDINRIHGDIKSLCDRMDQTNQRIDQTQSIIMRMLEKQGR